MPNTIAVQIGIFGLIITSILIVEHLVCATCPRKKIKHVSLNSLFVLTVLPVQIPMSIACLSIATWSASTEWGLVYLLPNPGNPWIKFVLMFVFLDFLDYMYHFTMHHVPAFWRFHLVHHSDLTVDVSTTVREHPGETFCRNVYLITWVFICGASPEILVLRQMAQSAFNLLSHASFRFPTSLGHILGWVFITPNLHHIHHHIRRPFTDNNFGDVFSIWDRLFGTLSALPGMTPTFGVDTHNAYVAHAGFPQILTMPFRKDLGRGAQTQFADCTDQKHESMPTVGPIRAAETNDVLSANERSKSKVPDSVKSIVDDVAMSESALCSGRTSDLRLVAALSVVLLLIAADCGADGIDDAELVSLAPTETAQQIVCNDAVADIPLGSGQGSAGIMYNLAEHPQSLRVVAKDQLRHAVDVSAQAHTELCVASCSTDRADSIVFKVAPVKYRPVEEQEALCVKLAKETATKPLDYGSRDFSSLEQFEAWMMKFIRGQGVDGNLLYAQCGGDCDPNYTFTVTPEKSGFNVATEVYCGFTRDRGGRDIFNISTALRSGCAP
ncbi:MAG: sterol desaturase family protein [Proteobacteria bacterium]|nr:sterol desaturase family protein [Pseudomonadota bacterium]